MHFRSARGLVQLQSKCVEQLPAARIQYSLIFHFHFALILKWLSRDRALLRGYPSQTINSGFNCFPCGQHAGFSTGLVQWSFLTWEVAPLRCTLDQHAAWCNCSQSVLSSYQQHEYNTVSYSTSILLWFWNDFPETVRYSKAILQKQLTLDLIVFHVASMQVSTG